jgi:DNA-binding Xre family transcriptional regulator
MNLTKQVRKQGFTVNKINDNFVYMSTFYLYDSLKSSRSISVSKQYFLNYLNELVDKSSFNKTILAERAKISRVTLHKLLNGDVEESKLSTMVNLAYALDVHPFELIRRYFAASPVQLPSTEHRAPSTEHRAPSTEHRAPSTEHRAPSTQHSCLICWLKSTAAQ